MILKQAKYQRLYNQIMGLEASWESEMEADPEEWQQILPVDDNDEGTDYDCD